MAPKPKPNPPRPRAIYHGAGGSIKYKKPAGMEDWLTIDQLAQQVGRSPRYLRKLCRVAETINPARFPVAKRVPMGKLQIRLFSPRMVEEAREILTKMTENAQGKKKRR